VIRPKAEEKSEGTGAEHRPKRRGGGGGGGKIMVSGNGKEKKGQFANTIRNYSLPTSDFFTQRGGGGGTYAGRWAIVAGQSGNLSREEKTNNVRDTRPMDFKDSGTWNTAGGDNDHWAKRKKQRLSITRDVEK